MANEGAIDTELISMRLPLTILRKIAKTYGKPGETSYRHGFIRFLEDKTGSIGLDEHDIEIIKSQMADNMRKRMENRRLRALKKAERMEPVFNPEVEAEVIATATRKYSKLVRGAKAFMNQAVAEETKGTKGNGKNRKAV